jgi:hypothetical protein
MDDTRCVAEFRGAQGTYMTYASGLVSLLIMLVVASGCGGRQTVSREFVDVGLAKPINEVVRMATPNDARQRPDSKTEWWYAAASDPDSGRSFSVAFYAAPYPAIVNTLSAGGRTSREVDDWRVLSIKDGHTGVGIKLAEGSFKYLARLDQWTISEDTQGYRIRLRFHDGERGMTVRSPLRVGSESAQWSFLLATSLVDGSILTPSGHRITVNGWRGYLEHTWGKFSLHSSRFQGWDWAAIHEPQGDAWVMLSVTLSNGVETPVLLRVVGGRRTVCRPIVNRQGSIKTNIAGVRVPRRIDVRCNGERGTFYVTHPYVTPVIHSLLGESLARSTIAGSVGMIEHFESRRAER